MSWPVCVLIATLLVIVAAAVIIAIVFAVEVFACIAGELSEKIADKIRERWKL